MKDSVKNMKIQARDWEKMVYKILVSKTYKDFSKPNSKTTNNPIRKWAKLDEEASHPRGYTDGK